LTLSSHRFQETKKLKKKNNNLKIEEKRKINKIKEESRRNNG
jgi:hypothetical protein